MMSGHWMFLLNLVNQVDRKNDIVRTFNHLFTKVGESRGYKSFIDLQSLKSTEKGYTSNGWFKIKVRLWWISEYIHWQQEVYSIENYWFCDVSVVDILYLHLYMLSAMVTLNGTFYSNIISEIFFLMLQYLSTIQDLRVYRYVNI